MQNAQPEADDKHPDGICHRIKNQREPVNRSKEHVEVHAEKCPDEHAPDNR
ncbi:hypothetical protein SDC9_144764 [bioreactor metagenome]|uniref:Uncharacterized protein n=1 Tax=bioreactor metagenome TaxID=1076179 RepID=A0A645E849_9ZZZZ